MGQTNVINYVVRLKIVKWCLNLFREGAKNIIRGSTYLVNIGNVYIQYIVVVMENVKVCNGQI